MCCANTLDAAASRRQTTAVPPQKNERHCPRSWQLYDFILTAGIRDTDVLTMPNDRHLHMRLDRCLLKSERVVWQTVKQLGLGVGASRPSHETPHIDGRKAL